MIQRGQDLPTRQIAGPTDDDKDVGLNLMFRHPQAPSCERSTVSWQDAETVRQRRSRIVQTLNVPQRVRLGPSLAAALLDELFEQPAGVFSCCTTREDPRNSRVLK